MSTDIRQPASAGRAEAVPATRGAVFTAHLISLIVLPSGIWRVVLGFGATLGFSRAALDANDMPGAGTVQVIVLSLVSEAVALLSLGLVRPWGEVVPRWVPQLGGRRIPVPAVVVPATAGGIALTALWLSTVPGLFTIPEISGTGWRLLLIACYLPLVLWGPLLLWLTYRYHRRRTGAG